MGKNKTYKELLEEVGELRERLEEAEETLRAIRSGEVDALVVSGENGDQIFTLKSAEQPYRLLIEEIKEGAVILADNDTIIYCNHGFADMLKIPLEKVTGVRISDFVLPADKPSFDALLHQGKRGNSRGEITFTAGKISVPVQLSINKFQVDNVQSVGLIITDLTDRKRAEEVLRKARDELEIRVDERTAQLRESEHRYATTLAGIGDAVIATDVKGRITFMNAVAENLTGWSLAEASAQPLPAVFKIINEQTREAVEDPAGRVIRSGVVVGLANHTILVRKDGTEVPIDDSGAPIKDREGMTMGVVLVFRDITERKKIDKISLENERLISANKARSEFLTIMSHELRTPLTSIIGYSILLKENKLGKMNDEQAFFVDNILASSKHLLDLINSTLDLAKMEAGKLEIIVEEIPVPYIINDTLKLLKERFAVHNIVLKTEFDPELMFIKADRQKFKQILFNLLSNAVKFSKEEGGIITVSVERAEEMAKISVSDTGIGIKEDDMPRLFQKFEQLDSGISRKYEGTGIGLSITKQLVEMHGGRIYVESKYGEGSTFTVLLPIAGKTAK